MPPTKCENDLLFGGREDNSGVTLWGSRRRVSMSVLCFFPWRISCGSQRSLRPFPVPPFLQLCHTRPWLGATGPWSFTLLCQWHRVRGGRNVSALGISPLCALCVFLLKSCMWDWGRRQMDLPHPGQSYWRFIPDWLKCQEEASRTVKRGGWALPAQTTCLPDLPTTHAEKAPWRPKGSHVKGGSTQTPFW